jgi:hypothetical protein
MVQGLEVKIISSKYKTKSELDKIKELSQQAEVIMEENKDEVKKIVSMMAFDKFAYGYVRNDTIDAVNSIIDRIIEA